MGKGSSRNPFCCQPLFNLFKFTLVADKFLSFSVHLIKYNEGIYFHAEATEIILAVEI